MASFSLATVSEALQDVSNETSGVSFTGKAAKWEKQEDVKELIKAINDCKHLNFLDLEGNTLGCDPAKCIGEALRSHPEFKRALWKDLFTGRMKEEIPVALKDLSSGIMLANAHLTVLDCSDNALGPNGMKGLVDLIRSPSCYSLQELRFMNCGLGITGAKMLAESLTICFDNSLEAGTPLELRVFAAGRNRLENEGTKALSAIFTRIQTLQEITIPQNGIYYPGMEALAGAIKENPQMQILNFNDNTMGAKGAIAISEALYAIEGLREINFSDCLLKTKGALSLSDVLSDCHPDLEVLNLSGNEIGPEAGEVLATSVTHKDNLREFILDCNQFGAEGVDIIRDILDSNGKIDILSIEDDEGLNSDEEDEQGSDYDDGEEEEEEEGDYDTDNADEYEGELIIGDTSTSSHQNFETSLDNSILLNSSLTAEPDSVAAFCQLKAPTINSFNQIKDDDKTKAFRDYLSNASDEDYLTHLVFTILKLSSIADQSTEALTLAQELFRDAFNYAKDKDRVKSVRNFFLVQLGLLKTEVKEFKPTYNIKSCRTALEHAIKENSLPDDEKSIFELFLNTARWGPTA